MMEVLKKVSKKLSVLLAAAMVVTSISIPSTAVEVKAATESVAFSAKNTGAPLAATPEGNAGVDFHVSNGETVSVNLTGSVSSDTVVYKYFVKEATNAEVSYSYPKNKEESWEASEFTEMTALGGGKYAFELAGSSEETETDVHVVFGRTKITYTNPSKNEIETVENEIILDDEYIITYEAKAPEAPELSLAGVEGNEGVYVIGYDDVATALLKSNVENTYYVYGDATSENIVKGDKTIAADGTKIEFDDNNSQETKSIYAVATAGTKVIVTSPKTSITVTRKAKAATKPDIIFKSKGKEVTSVPHGVSVNVAVQTSGDGEVFLMQYVPERDAEAEITGDYISKNGVKSASYDITGNDPKIKKLLKNPGAHEITFYAVSVTGDEPENYVFSDIRKATIKYERAKLELKDKEPVTGSEYYEVEPGKEYTINIVSENECKATHSFYVSFEEETNGSTLKGKTLKVSEKDAGNYIQINGTCGDVELEPLFVKVKDAHTVTVIDLSADDNTHGFSVSMNNAKVEFEKDSIEASSYFTCSSASVVITAEKDYKIVSVQEDGEEVLIDGYCNTLKKVFVNGIDHDCEIYVTTEKYTESTGPKRNTIVASREVDGKRVAVKDGDTVDPNERIWFTIVSNNGINYATFKIKGTVPDINEEAFPLKGPYTWFRFEPNPKYAGKEIKIEFTIGNDEDKQDFTVKVNNLWKTAVITNNGVVMPSEVTADIGGEYEFVIKPEAGYGKIHFEPSNANNTTSTIKDGVVTVNVADNATAGKSAYFEVWNENDPATTKTKTKLTIVATAPKWTASTPVVKVDTVRTGSNQIVLKPSIKVAPADVADEDYYWYAKASSTVWGTAKYGEDIVISSNGIKPSTAYTVDVYLLKANSAPTTGSYTIPKLATAKTSVNVSTLAALKTEKITLKKINTKVPNGLEVSGVTKRKTSMEIANLNADKNSGYRNDAAYGVKIYNAYGDEYTDITGRIVNGKLVIDVAKCVPTGKYTASVYVLDNTDKNAKQTEDADVKASIAFNIVSGIDEVSADAQTFYKKSGKQIKTKIQAKLTGTNGTPAYKKVKYDIVSYNAINANGTKSASDALEAATKLDKNGNLTIDKSFAGEDKVSDYEIVVKISADDYVAGELTGNAIVNIKTAESGIGSVCVAKKNTNGTYTPVTEVELYEPNDTEYELVALKKGAVLHNGKIYAEDIVDSSYYVSKSSNSKAVSVENLGDDNDVVTAKGVAKATTLSITTAEKKTFKCKVKSVYATLDPTKVEVSVSVNSVAVPEKNLSGAYTNTDNVEVTVKYNSNPINDQYNLMVVPNGFKKLYKKADGTQVYALSKLSGSFSVVPKTDKKSVIKTITMTTTKLDKAPKFTSTKSLVAGKLNSNVLEVVLATVPAGAKKVKFVAVDNNLDTAIKGKTASIVNGKASLDLSEGTLKVANNKMAVTFLDKDGKAVCQSKVVTVASKKMKYSFKLNSKVVFDKDATKVVLAPKYDKASVEEVKYEVKNAFKKGTGSYNTFASKSFTISNSTLSLKAKSWADVPAEDMTGVIHCTVTYKDGAVREYDTTVKVSMKKK